MMNCQGCRDDLVAYLDEELEQSMQAQVEDHLERCVSCRQEHDSLRQSYEFTETYLSSLEPSPYLWTRISAGLRGEPMPVRAPWSWLAARISNSAVAVRLAAVAILVLGVGSSWLFYHERKLTGQARQEMVQFVADWEGLDVSRVNPFLARHEHPVDELEANPFIDLHHHDIKNPFRHEER
ncbi:MAG: zf-HC2 domain-containing protein [Acidobacteria bacterium]|nr:zf-HC2 domain-containing protein [Acidobacteriota bacterium]